MVKDKINFCLIDIQELDDRLSELKAIIQNRDDEDGVIITGFPRNVEEAKQLEKLLSKLGLNITKVVSFQIENKNLIERSRVSAMTDVKRVSRPDTADKVMALNFYS